MARAKKQETRSVAKIAEAAKALLAEAEAVLQKNPPEKYRALREGQRLDALQRLRLLERLGVATSKQKAGSGGKGKSAASIKRGQKVASSKR